MGETVGRGWRILAVMAAFAVVMLLWGMGQYNRVVAMDEGVKGQWAQVENQLKRRLDLIPNLVETVKGYAGHERQIFSELAQARTAYFQAGTVGEKIVASGGLEQALSRLLMLQENYPNLKANEAFLKLQDSLEGTENRIAVERTRYNDRVLLLNTHRRTLQGRLFAALAGVEAAAYFSVPEEAGTPPRVAFP